MMNFQTDEFPHNEFPDSAVPEVKKYFALMNEKYGWRQVILNAYQTEKTLTHF